jgi:hypothetical protein
VHMLYGRRLTRFLQGLGYPDSGVTLVLVEEQLLRFSNAIRFEDDLTFVEVRLYD